MMMITFSEGREFILFLNQIQNRSSEINSFHSMILLPLKYNPGKLKVLYTIF